VLEIILLRLGFVLILGSIAWLLRPFELNGYASLAVGVCVGGFAILLERKLKSTSLTRLIGAIIGSVAGVIGALLIALILNTAVPASTGTVPFLQLCLLGIGLYIGLTVGARKGELLNLSALGGLVGGDNTGRAGMTLIDTSVVIDGRIADVAETGFLGGALAIPQFVLRELQLVADSADVLKRNRGRRGLDILQRLQKMPQLNVQILDDDFPNIRDVDMKLVELGKQYGCKVVTNDFNLNKVAHLHGVQVLNINELANALKPVVLPGEIMRVFVIKEGKEYNQGVAYLDDGTMVVIDNARRLISKTIDVTVTSVLQTTAGKMIFGRFDERLHSVYDKAGTTTAAGAVGASGTSGSTTSTLPSPGQPSASDSGSREDRAHFGSAH
jgi:uncharacterized protein YacL